MPSVNYDVADLLAVMEKLRDPKYGCPWDLKQTFTSIVPSTLEECFELVDAIESEDFPHIKEELGDLLFQVIFYGQLGKEKDYFNFEEIVSSLVTKLLRRHPHVFPNGHLDDIADSSLMDEQEIKVSWENIKASERQSKKLYGLLDDIPRALPALSRANKLQKRASSVGFDWPDCQGAIRKVKEELAELEAAIKRLDDGQIKEELGDLLFSCVNLSRKLNHDPESSLRNSNRKFEDRFNFIEEQLVERGISVEDADIELMDRLWEEAKIKT